MTPDTCPTCCRKCKHFYGHVQPCVVDEHGQGRRWACSKACDECSPDDCPKFEEKKCSASK